MGYFVNSEGRYYTGDWRRGLIEVPERPSPNHYWDFDINDWLEKQVSSELSGTQQVKLKFAEITSGFLIGGEITLSPETRQAIAEMRSKIHFVLEDLDDATSKVEVQNHLLTIKSIFDLTDLPVELSPLKQAMVDFINQLYTGD